MASTRAAHHHSKVPLVRTGKATTTPAEDSEPKKIHVDTQVARREQNEEYLKDGNVKAFLAMIGKAEGGDYHAKFGWVRGKSDWTFTDESTHPGAGKDGKTTASGLYQINIACWTEHGKKLQGLSDFSPHTQDLIAVDNIRGSKVIQNVVDGDIQTAINKLKTNQWTSFQVRKYELLEGWYKEAGGSVK